MSIRSKFRFAVVSALSVGAIAGTVAFAGGASAATTNQPQPRPLPAACRTHSPFSDRLQLTYNNTTFNYQVRLHLAPVFFQRGVLVVRGTLCDLNEPVPLVLRVHGIVFGNVAILSVTYPSVGPDAGNQGIRTFVGVIGPFGHVTGSWSETGTEAGSGPFTLARI